MGSGVSYTSGGIDQSDVAITGGSIKGIDDPVDEHGVGDQGFNDARYVPKNLSAAKVTDPAINEAVATDIIDTYGGVIITLTEAGNSQTLQPPTDTSAIKRFIVVTHEDNGAYEIDVNGITMSAGQAQWFIWTGTEWVAITAVDADDMAFTPTGDLVATTVQGMGAELDTEKEPRTDRVNLIYVGKHGNDSKDGLTPADAKLTFAGARAAIVTAGDAAADTRYVIWCEDDGIYAEDLVGLAYVDLWVPRAAINPIDTHTLIDDVSWRIGRVTVPTGKAGFTKTAGTGTARTRIARFDCEGTAGGYLVTAGNVSIDVREASVENGYGIGAVGTTGHIDGMVSNLTITGSGTGVGSASAGSSITLRVGRIEDNGGSGTAVYIANVASTINLIAGQINCDTAWNVLAAGTLNVVCSNVVGTQTEVGTVNKAIMDSQFTAANEVMVGAGAGKHSQVTLGASEILARGAAGEVGNKNAAEARTIIDVDPAGTDNSTDVTLNASATTGGMSIDSQEISNRAASNSQTGYATAAQIVALELVRDIEKYVDSPCIVTGGEISAGSNAGTFKVAALTALLRKTDSATGEFAYVTKAEEDNITITAANTTYFVVLNYNGGTPTISVSETDPYTADKRNIRNGKVMKDGSDNVHFYSGGFKFQDAIKKLHIRARTLRSFELDGGSVIAYSGTNNFTMSEGIAYGGINDFPLAAYNSASTQFVPVYSDGGAGFTYGAARNTIDYEHYDDGDGTLGDIGVSKYGIFWVYRLAGCGHVYVRYGEDSYSLAEAEAVIDVPNVPSLMTDFGLLIGKIVAPQTGGSFAAIQGVQDVFFSGTASSDHAELGNLDKASSGHTGFASSGANTDITSLALDDGLLLRPEIKDYSETKTAPSSTDNVLTLDVVNGNVFSTLLTENITTLNFNNPSPSGKACSFTWIVTQHSSAVSIVWPVSVKWDSGTVPIITANNGIYVFTFITYDAGTTWFGFLAGSEMAVPA